MEVSGKITKILDKVTGHKKDASGTWEKQNFVLETDEKYNNIYCLKYLVQRRCLTSIKKTQ